MPPLLQKVRWTKGVRLINNLAFCYVIRYKWISDNGSFPGYEKLNKQTAKTG
ncbi:hypothetical protein ES703_13745 [subsurface metagenome]